MKSTLSRLVMASTLVVMVSASAVNAQSSTPEEDLRMAKEFMQTAQAFVQSAVGGNGNVSVTVKGDTATLIGFVDSSATKRMAETAALMDMRVNKVVSHILSN